MAQAQAENFPVASRLLPRRERSHLLAIYGFARLVDDIGDEATGDRLASLRWLEDELDAAFSGRAQHPLLRALEPTLRERELPREPFERLIEANRQDQSVHSYETFKQLLEYCKLSANPVGELVLAVFGAATPARIELSDAVCSALQLVEHWQDVGEDYRRGRVYIPSEELARCDCGAEDLAADSSSDALRDVLVSLVARTHILLNRGAPLISTLRGRPAFAVAAFIAGGRAALDAIEQADYDVLGARPRPTRARRTTALLRTLAGAHW